MSYKVKGAPWDYPGVKHVQNCKTAADVMSAAGLDWEVDKCEVYAAMNNFGERSDINDGFIKNGTQFKTIPNGYATYRCDTNEPLGLVKGKYTPVQNVDAFNFFDNAIGTNKAIWDTAGFFGKGERIFVSAKLPKTVIIGGKDPVDNYLVFTNSHDGSSGVKILYTPIRIVCQNVLSSAIRHASSYISFRHTKSVHSKIDIADEILGICKNKIDAVSETFQYLEKKKVTDIDIQKYFTDFILTSDEKTRLKDTGHTIKQLLLKDGETIEDSGISTRKVNILSDMYDYYLTGVGQHDFRGTAWGAYNAVTGYYSNVANSDGYKRMDSILYGDKANKIELATNLAIAL